MKKLSFATNCLQLKLSFVTIIFSNDVCKQHILVMQTIILVTNNWLQTIIFPLVCFNFLSESTLQGALGGGGGRGYQENAIFIIYVGIFGVFFIKISSNVLINI
jgi:hypothetical protein